MTRNLGFEVQIPYAELVEFLDNAAIGIHRVAADGTVLWMNRAELSLLGYEAHELVGQHIATVHADARLVDDMLARLARGETLRDCEARLVAKDGSIKHVLIDSNVYRRDGKFMYTRCFVRDVSERKRAEAAAAEVREALALTLRQNEMFASLLAHDLRNPLGAIVMAAQLALRRADDDRLVKPLHRILIGGARMSRMIDQLLDFTRARMAGGLRIEREAADLLAIVNRAVAEVRATNPNFAAQVEAAGDLHGEWSVGRLTQVFATLMSNAAEHAPPPCVVCARADDDFVYADVHSPAAISSTLLPRLFEPFRGAVDRREGQSALGLGLFITKEIVLAHGGELEVSSSPNDGATFSLKLPRRVARTAPAGDPTLRHGPRVGSTAARREGSAEGVLS